MDRKEGIEMKLTCEMDDRGLYFCGFYMSIHGLKRWLSTLLPSNVFTLRDYQEECLQACLNAFHRDNVKRQAVSLPVGSGKTMIFSNLISRLPPPTQIATKTLVLAHREELLEQACRMIDRANPGLRVCIEQGRSRADPDNSDVIVASVPTLGRRDSHRLAKYVPDKFKCIIIDEAHHAAAESYMRILQHFGALDPSSHILLWGCSATMNRNDHLALGSVFEKVVFHVDLVRLMRQGYLSPLRSVQIQTDVDLSGIDTKSEDDFDTQQLSLAIDTPGRNRLVADTWHKVAWEEHQRLSTIVFGLNVKHVENLAHEFHRLGVTKPAVITGDTSDVVRREIIEMYGKGTIGILLNCAVLTEGTDLPRTDCVLLTRPTCNPNLYIQMVGRGLRRHPDKEYCLLLDVVDNGNSGNRSLITFPSLLPKRNEPGEGEEGEQRTPKLKKSYSDLDKLRVKLLQNDVLGDLLDLGGHRIAWIPVTPDTLLASDGNTNLVLKLDQPVLEKLSCSIGIQKGKDTSILLQPSGTPLHVALEALTRQLHDNDQLERFSKNAHWRRYQITSGQLRYVCNIAKKMHAEDSVYKDVYEWSIGRASEIISKYAFLRTNNIPLPSSWGSFMEGLSSLSLIRRRRK
jgi:superfamily II DNA or RNA helicase